MLAKQHDFLGLYRWSLGSLGVLYCESGDPESALDPMKIATEITQAEDELRGSISRGGLDTKGWLALIYSLLGRYDEAHPLALECVGAARELGYQPHEASWPALLGCIESHLRLESAARHFDDGQKIIEALEAHFAWPFFWACRGQHYALNGFIENAESDLKRLESHLREEKLGDNGSVWKFFRDDLVQMIDDYRACKVLPFPERA